VKVYSRHKRDCTSKKPYKCSQCTKSFARTSDFTKHLRVHTGERNYRCSVCTKRFARADTMRKHIRSQTGERLYSCTLCTKAFTDKRTLLKHLNFHRKKKLQIKSLSTKSEAEWCDLQRHLRFHADVKFPVGVVCAIQREKPSQYSQCSKLFVLSGNMQIHLRVHTLALLWRTLYLFLKKKITLWPNTCKVKGSKLMFKLNHKYSSVMPCNSL